MLAQLRLTIVAILRELWFDEVMTTQEAIKHFGSVALLAKAMDVSDQAVRKWIKYGIPYDRQCQIQVATAGTLIANKPEKAAA